MNRLRTMAGALALGLALLGSQVHADPRSDFFCRMLTHEDARVRMSAALRLGDLHDASSVPALVAALLREPTAATRVAMISALIALDDPRSLDAAQEAMRDPSAAVRAQAVRLLAGLRARDPSVGARSAVTPRFQVTVGTFTADTARRGTEVPTTARLLLTAALAAHPEVLVAETSAGMRPHLRSFFIDGAVHFLGVTEQGARAEVSLVVQTDPGREFRFESSGAATVQGTYTDTSPAGRAAEQSALRAAVESATARTLTQLAATP